MLACALWTYLYALSEVQNGESAWSNWRGYSVFYGQLYALAIVLAVFAFLPWGWISRRMAD
jgi:hypothetical protein